MKKEDLHWKKRSTVVKSDISNKAKFILTDNSKGDYLSQFSIHQLETICELIKKIEDQKENNNPFKTLSACEVLQKSTGKIAYFEADGTVREESESEVMSGAASLVYKNFLDKNKSKKTI